MTAAEENKNFYGLGVAPGILEILNSLKFTVPTPIQQKAIPLAAEGKDVIGIAQTGTGKTLAFCIPMIQRLASRPEDTGLVVVPTRELAQQVNETFLKIAPAFSIKTAVLIGGSPMRNQLSSLRKKPRVIIATPGRLIDHIERQTINLNKTRVVVLDEADRMLDMGFMPQVNKILKKLPRPRQVMLFSATIPSEIIKIAASQMKMPVRTEIAPSGTAPHLISQEIFVVKRENKFKALSDFLKDFKGSVLLFARTKRGASNITRRLKKARHSAAEIHSDRTMGQRKEALKGFKSGKYRILVATDIASRGLDVTGIELVVNYDLPDDPENYIHRIGRTGRAGEKGHSITFAAPDQGNDVKDIENIMKIEIPRSSRPSSEKLHTTRAKVVWSSGRGRFRKRK